MIDKVIRPALFLVVTALIPLHAQLPADVTANAVSLLPADPLAAPSFHAADGHGAGEAVAAANDRPAEFRVTVTEPPANIWEIGLNWPTVAPIADTDVLLLSFEARTTSPPSGGEIRAVCRRSAKPYMHCLNDTVRPGPDWKEVAFVFTPGFAETGGDTRLILNFGGRTQVTEVRNLSFLNLKDTITVGQAVRRFGRDVVRPGRQAVGTPLTPQVLWDIGAVDDLGANGVKMESDGGWAATYAIWTCHGYMFHANRTVGMLEITRGPTHDGTFTLSIRQDLVNDEGILHRVTVEAHCRADPIASPLSWVLGSRCLGPEGNAMPQTETHAEALVQGNRWQTTRNGRTVERTLSLPLTTDWGLFEAVTRLPHSTEALLACDLLEGFSLLKTDQELRYRGIESVRMGRQSVRLHHITLLGHGILPYGFWLDDRGRVVLAVTHSRVYISDADAETRMKDHLDAQKKRYRNLLPRLEARKEGN